MATPTADDLICALGLKPHPEGGYYAETYRAPTRDGERSPLTCIYFLLQAGEVSHWHRVDADEVWLFQAGDPLDLAMADASGSRSVTVGPVGLSAAGGEIVGHAVVPAGTWQAARSCGAWSLVACTVAPGFEFAGFELAAAGWCPPGWEGW